MKKYFFIFCVLLLVNHVWSTPSVQLQTQRHRTDWQFVNYRFLLTNTSSAPILNPEIDYYAVSIPLAAWVDYSSALNPVTASVAQTDQYAVVKFSLHGLLFPGQSVEIHCRIYKADWTGWNSSADWSYQKNAEVYEPNYFMTVYDASHNILWGFDPLNGNVNVSDIVLWTDGESNFIVNRYDGDTSEIVPAGRFWMLKDTPVSVKERDLLAVRGVIKYSSRVYQGKTMAFFRSEIDVKKAMLDSLVAGFYNTVPVNDSDAVGIGYYQDDLYEDSSKIDMEIYCWPDVSVNGCVEEVIACGGTDIGVARGFLVAQVRKDSLQCLSQNVNVHGLAVEHELGVASSAIDRDAVNISELQTGTAWDTALASARATKSWLSGVEHTGEGIVVGVYDNGIDFRHPALCEYSSNDSMTKRFIVYDEYFGVSGYGSDTNYDVIMSAVNTKEESHGTNVAGILGGNGNNSESFKNRGIAPKVHFYPYYKRYNSQIGHVSNHSHITTDNGYYADGDYYMDAAIFKNWKSICTKISQVSPVGRGNCVEGDTLVKTVVFAAANNGDNVGKPDGIKYGIQRGYHSILANSKNAITVGNMTSEEKVRFHHSSMGPTWDGRIKPDIMAPGATSQVVASESHPVEILVDYVKLYRQGSAMPYFALDSSAFSVKSDSLSKLFADAMIDTLGDDKYAYKFISKSTMHLGITTLWNFDSVTILPTDSIEVCFHGGSGWKNDKPIYGSIFLGTDYDAWDIKVPVVWNPHGDTVSRFSLNSIIDSMSATYLRLDFSYIRGIIAPTVCNDTLCGYDFPTEGGTSNAAPFVSGIAALMYQKFRDTTGDSLNRHSMRNSTVKALMIHTAVDMEDSPVAHFSNNPDLQAAHHDGQPHYTPYGKGPDFATGWGYVDGKAALDLISDYNGKTKEFAKFREIEIGHGVEKRWTTIVSSGQNRLRATLVWDDAPGPRDTGWVSVRNPKLVNDLDMYLVSPSGEYHYPWRLDPLPTDFIDTSGNFSYVATGFENIHESDVHDAYNDCSVGNLVGKECFDHLNNVEVVDVENPEPGTWQVIVLGRYVGEFNNVDSNAQVATLVSDSKLSENERCSVVHNYAPQTDYRCTYALGNDAISYVTFDERTYVGAGDYIELFDEKGTLLGTYVENQLAGKKLKFKSKQLTVVLHSDNDNSQGWGFDITKIKVYPISVLKMPFEFTKKVGGNP